MGLAKKEKKEKKDEIYETIFADRGNLASWGGLKGAAAASRSGEYLRSAAVICGSGTAHHTP